MIPCDKATRGHANPEIVLWESASKIIPFAFVWKLHWVNGKFCFKDAILSQKKAEPEKEGEIVPESLEFRFSNYTDPYLSFSKNISPGNRVVIILRISEFMVGSENQETSSCNMEYYC